jgi:hypothetical protein
LKLCLLENRIPRDNFRATSLFGHVTYMIRDAAAALSITDFNEGAAQPKVVEKRRGDKCVRRRVKVNKRKVKGRDSE